MTLLNDTIADINAEVDTVATIMETVFSLKANAEEREDRMSSEDYDEMMWNYNNAIDSLETVIKELKYASDKLVDC